jgi:hypothetical protein
VTRFYALLDSTAEVPARFKAGSADGEREIVIYRLGVRARAAIDAFGPLDPLWWADCVPNAFRMQAEATLVPASERTHGRLRNPRGEPADWVWSISPTFQTRVDPFAIAMSFELMEHGRPDLACRFAKAVLELNPGYEWACLTYSEGARRLGDSRAARVMVERSLNWIARSGRRAPALELEHADLLVESGLIAQARAELEQVLRSSDAAAENEARRRLNDPHGPFTRSP